MRKTDLMLFALEASRKFGSTVAGHLGLELSRHEEREFEDGEHKARPLENVRGRDVFVLNALYGDLDQSANDKLIRLLFFLGALRDGGAGRITALVPYLCYARKDRQTKARDPVTTRYVAQILEAVGVDCVVTLDVHNPAAFQNAFRCTMVHLETRQLFAENLAERLGDREFAVVSPDVGGVKRAEAFREALVATLGRDVSSGFMEKKRSRGAVTGDAFAGEVAGRTVLIVDDLISTGTTMARAARASLERGARTVIAVAAHGLFIDAEATLRDGGFEEVVVTDSVPAFRLSEGFRSERLRCVSAAPLFAEAVRRLHEHGSIEDLAAQPE